MVKNLPASTGDTRDRGLTSWLGRGIKNGNPLQYSCLKNSIDRGAWWGVAYSPWGCKELNTTEWLSSQHENDRDGVSS